MTPSRVFLTTSISLALSIVAFGCSKGSAGITASGDRNGTNANAPKGGSCNEAKAGLCTEFNDNPAGIAEGTCTSVMQGTYAKDACNRANTIGSCASKDDVTYYYFGNAWGPWTEDAADDCKNVHEGTFTATPGASDNAKLQAIPSPDHIEASCVQDANACDDIYGDPIKLSISKSFCDGSGKWNDGKACPTDGLVATCLAGGTAHRYYGSYLKKNGLTMSGLASLCKTSSIGYSHFYPAAGAPVAAGPQGLSAAKGKRGK
jgi:hypothetical protein